jgi:endonuclease G, mitochondrial
MKIIFTYLSILLIILFNSTGTAQGTIAAWDFTGSSSPVTWPSSLFNVNLINTGSADDVTRGATATASTGANSFRTQGFQNNGISTANTDYFQVTLTAATGYKLSLSTIDAKLTGTSSFYASPGVTSQFAYSLDGTNFTLINSPQVVIGGPQSLAQIDVSAVGALQNVVAGTTVTLRYYASGQTTTGGWGFYSVTSGTYGLAIGGTVVSVECVLSLTALIQGLYNGSVMIPDSVTVELHDASSFALVDKDKELLSASGTGIFTFSNAINSTNYYIVVKHRNSIETWSASVQHFTSYALSYDFTTAATQAYGSNLILKSGKYCIYSGDVNQDGVVDGIDLGNVDNDNNAFVTGYTSTDLNGDGVVDGIDLGVIDNNNNAFISKNTPAPSSVFSLTGALINFSQFSSTPSAEQTYNISGTGLTTNVTVVPPAGFEISKTTGIGFVNSSGSLVYTAADVMAGKTIYVRMNAGSAGSYSGSITHTSIGSEFTPVTQSVSGTYLIISGNVNLTMGNPTFAVTLSDSIHNYLLDKPQFCASYDRDRAIANWTSWELDATWLIKNSTRHDPYRVDTTLPAGWPQVGSGYNFSTYGFERGHLCPSADRVNTQVNNDALFVMTNLIPQSSESNGGPWGSLEGYERTLVGQGNVLYILCGGWGTGGTSDVGTFNSIVSTSGVSATVPNKLWKVIIVVPNGDGTSTDVSRVTTSTRTIAVIMDNNKGPFNSWDTYRVSVDSVESLTGYDFFSNVSTSIQAVIEANVDTGPTN